MRFSLMIVALLCFTAWVNLANASTHGHVSSCCLQHSNTRVALGKLSHYRRQEEGVCPIKAVVFQTTRGKTICSDPNNSWAKRMISTLDQRQASKMMGKKKESVNTITPTVSAMSERFRTSLNKQVETSDPDSSWTTTGVLNTDKEPHMLQMKGNNEGISTTSITPIVSSTSKSKPKKKGRRRKTRLRKSRSGRRWMKKVNIVVEISGPR